ERAADDAPQAGREGGEVRRQHRGSGYLGGGMFYRFGILLCLAWAASAAGDTRVADAASRGDREAVRALARQKADVKGAQGDGMTALHWAAFHDDVEMAKLLLAAGADVKAATREGALTPLFLACENGGAAVVAALLAA